MLFVRIPGTVSDCGFLDVVLRIIIFVARYAFLFWTQCFFFFFQAEDGIRDVAVTGVQTCALPISLRRRAIRPVGPAPPPRRAGPVGVPRLARSSAGSPASGRPGAGPSCRWRSRGRPRARLRAPRTGTGPPEDRRPRPESPLRRAALSPPAGRPAHAVRRRPAAAPHLARAQRTCPRERRRRRRPSPRAGTPRNDTRARGRGLERQTRLP